MGAILATSGFWSSALDQVMLGAHAFAGIAGAIIGAHGLWRIARKRNKRQSDKDDQDG